MNSNKLTIKDSSLAFFMGFLLCQLCVLVVLVFAVIFCAFINIDPKSAISFFDTAIGYLISVTAMNAGMVAVFFFFNKNKNNSIISKPKPNKTLIYIAVALASLALHPIVNVVDKLLINLGVPINTIPYTINTPNYFISLFSLVVVPAICEELLFRGLILKGLKPYGKVFSIVITALMFAIFHMSIDQFLYPLLMGLLLSYIMHKEDNIFYCILVHAINNFISLTFAYFNISLFINHIAFVVLAIVLAVIFLSVMLYLIIKNKNKEDIIKPNKTENFYFFFCLGVMILMWIIINLNK